ncbi:hypothetical protein [Sphingosinicella rhizophila]|uniref:Uncharacterized protein n=1 Tax=Sphingosinicella rhizophila TaxID=3050082 RepID=A0ABU3Q1M9_9SPHN|nr:hypothetical protein [Sphingosinicella sp. GR2756]MDT9597337.1 hypothetical protein [Sphingosinicella sp. GR2756]
MTRHDGLSAFDRLTPFSLLLPLPQGCRHLRAGTTSEIEVYRLLTNDPYER